MSTFVHLPRPATAKPSTLPDHPRRQKRTMARNGAQFVFDHDFRDSKRGSPQANLSLGPAHDPLEREADLIAARVVGMSAASSVASTGPEFTKSTAQIQRACAACEIDEERIQRVSEASLAGLNRNDRAAARVSPGLSAEIEAARHQGSPLPEAARTFFEARMGHDFSSVRVHDDNNATALNRKLGARAFTVGNDIFFKQNEFQPHRAAGRRLLAHELVHTVQQGAARNRIQRALAPEEEITAADQELLNAQKAAEERGARLIDLGRELKQGQVDLRPIKSDRPCIDEPQLNVRVVRVAGSLLPTVEMRSNDNSEAAILAIAGNGQASVSLIGPSRTARIIQTETLNWSLQWFCPREQTSGMTIDPGGKSGLAFASATGTGGREVASHEIPTDSNKGGGQLVRRGKAMVLQDAHLYGYSSQHARAMRERAVARGFDDRTCGFVLKQRFDALVGAFDERENTISRCRYSFVYTGERDWATGKVTVSVQYGDADLVEGTFKDSTNLGPGQSSEKGEE